MKVHDLGLPEDNQAWNILFLSDIHSLVSDRDAILLVLKAFAKTPIHQRKVVLGGDILDIKFLYSKDDAYKEAIRKGMWDDYFFPELDKEKIWWEEFYRLIRAYVMHPEDIVFLEGNHEERLRRDSFLKKVPHDLKHNFSLNLVLGADKKKMGLVKYRDWAKLAPLSSPPLYLSHGHHCGEYFLKKHVLELNAGAVMVGHLHEVGSKSFKRAEHAVTSYANPCLCDLDADYMENRAHNWSQGASQITVTREDLTVHQYHIINKKLYMPNGDVLS